MELDKIRAIDTEVAQHIEEELERQQTTIELIASISRFFGLFLTKMSFSGYY